MSGHIKERAHDRIQQLARAGLDVARFLNEASAALAPAVPNGTDYMEHPYWYTLDPQSQLITSDYGGDGCGLDTTAVMRWEYLDDDVNKYAEVLRHPRGVQTLHEVTGGEPERSRIYREYMAEAGMAQEMLVALRARTGEFWGTLRLNRGPGQPEFDFSDMEFMATVAPHLAGGVRRGLLVGEATDPDLPDAPGLVVLDARGEIESLSAGAEHWIALLPGPQIGDALPASVTSVAFAAVEGERGDGSGNEATARVRSVDGEWLSVHGTAISLEGTSKTAVIIEPAHRDRITPLLMAIYGLTTREQQVTQLVLKGRSTAELATVLRMSPHTVQQHLKSIFDRTGVHTRRELVGKVFFDSFDPRVTDNVQRVRVEKPIRGGPLREVP
ncbi:MAG TPA: helix-turn-helix transcriptional regulator [Actinomycetota bacterium]|nr:helix-turn-helix transcriptional regulator [Actinomycetota bacterium]